MSLRLAMVSTERDRLASERDRIAPDVLLSVSLVGHVGQYMYIAWVTVHVRPV